MLVPSVVPPLHTGQASYPGNDSTHGLNGSSHINGHNQNKLLQTYFEPRLNLDNLLLLCPGVVLGPVKLTIYTEHHSN